MSLLNELPDHVLDLLCSSAVSEFATVSSSGVPIDTPISCFPSEDLGSIDLATGLSYPAKAERARKNPKVGLFIEGRRNEPVLSIAGFASVKDADLQANAERYIAETAFWRPGNPPWPIARKAIWYWTRMIVCVAPARVLWWENRDAMEGPPNRLEAAANTVFPPSDPGPGGTVSKSPGWPQRPWEELAGEAVQSGVPGHLTLCDENGFPLPFRAGNIERCDEGFRLRVAGGAPWKATGKASLSFAGRLIFIGEVHSDGAEVTMIVERALPIHPFIADDTELWEPSADVHEKLMGRLRHETSRRGQPIPVMPEVEPEPTPLGKLRMKRMGAMAG